MAETLKSMEDALATDKQQAEKKVEEIEEWKTRAGELEAELERQKSQIEDLQSALKSQKTVNAELSGQLQQAVNKHEENLQKSEVGSFCCIHL